MHLLRSRVFGGISVAVAITVASMASTAAAVFPSSHSNTLDAQPATPTTTSTTTTTTASGNFALGDIVTFQATDFDDNLSTYQNDAIFLSTGSAAKYFGFTVASADYNVNDVSLNIVDNSLTIAKAFLSTPSSSTSLSSTSAVAMTLSFVEPVAGVTTTTQSYSIEIIDTSILASEYDSTALFFAVNWTQAGGSSGTSYSRRFAFTAANSVPESVLAQYTNTNPVLSETINTKTALTTAGTNPATATASTTRATSTNDGASLAGSASSSGSSGLSKGAIAGIVVGAIAAVAIIAALAFFFIRRRNSNSRKNAYNAALLAGSVEPYRGAGPVSNLGGAHANMHDGMGSGTAVNLMEKDALAGGVGAAAGRFAVAGREIGGANAPQSPHSPYTDEDANGTPQTIPSRNIGTSSRTGSAAGTPVVSPVAAQAQPLAGGVLPAAPSPVAVATAAAALPPPAPAPAMRGQVAALIEDHMTPEDVARLEAEELELDADIENAIRNRAAANSRQD
ncbi:hypothetical protein SCUCBS95973_002129 [Sporothrix curviconia]|uniref:Uncharacterized protein n=1 Tax=Sporothrix curviconia TaxID=1260050 RepID=A0ABP0B539_9PEZI